MMYVQRDLTGRFERSADAFKMVAMVGPRQAGKTTFLRKIGAQHHAVYRTFDDPDVRSTFDEDVKRFDMQYISITGPTILDEVTYATDPGIDLKFLADNGRKLWVTASSQSLLESSVLSHLVGRVSILTMYPFSLPEMLRARGNVPAKGTILDRAIWEHITYGGYPDVVLSEDVEMKRTILANLLTTMRIRDISNAFAIDDERSLELLVRTLAADPGGLVEYDRLCAVVGISFPTLKKYLAALEKGYLVHTVRPHFSNRTREITKRPRVYFLDTGILNTINSSFPTHVDGRVYETYVLTELVKAGLPVRFWRARSKAEVDFVVESKGRHVPIEAKLRASPRKVESGLRAFIRQYSPEKAYVVSLHGEHGVTQVDGCTITYLGILELLGILGS